MKTYQSASQPARSCCSSKLKHLRTVLLFALVGSLLNVPFHVLAQGNSASVTPKTSGVYAEYADGRGFVLYQDPNGDTVCRVSTQEEIRQLKSGITDYSLQQINHLQDGSSQPEPAQTANGLTIILRATAQLNANPEAKAAFIAAAAKWEALIKDPITIVLDVDYGTSFFGSPFPSGVLAGTIPQELAANYPDLRVRLNSHADSPQEAALYNALPAGSLPTDIGNTNTVLVASPLYRALEAIPADATTDTTTPGEPPRIGFNSASGFDFDPSDGITGNRTDFDAVAVHEMGHALGFLTEVGARELEPSLPIMASLWDLFRFRPGTVNLSNFNTVQRILSAGGTQVEFNGGVEVGLSTGRSDGSGGDGQQASHWRDDNNIDANYLGIMDPAIAPNKRKVMTANDEKAIDSFGYTISGAAPSPTPSVTPTPPIGCSYSLSPTSASPSAGATSGSFNVATSNGCSWAATSNASWITTTSSGNGNGTANYAVAANCGAARVGTISIADKTFTINQAASSVETTQMKFSAAAGLPQDRFGCAVAISGDTAIVGNCRSGSPGNVQGQAYIFVRGNDGNWSEQATLVPNDNPLSFGFGRSVAIDGNIAVVGASLVANGSNILQGAAYVFTRNGTSWTQQQKLLANDGAASDQFGVSVAILGNTIIVGALFDDVGPNTDQGSAYVFTTNGTTWTQQQKLTASDGAANDNFGVSVAISGDSAIVGAYFDDIGANTNQGSACVFVRSGTTWTQQQKLTASENAAGFGLGISVALEGNTAIVGKTTGIPLMVTIEGAAYVFVRNGTAWTQQQKLTANDGATNTVFGQSVAVWGNTAVIGAQGENVGANSDQGAVHVFVRSGTTWVKQQRITANDGGAGDGLGSSVAFDGNRMLVGARGDRVGTNPGQGSAYIFSSSPAECSIIQFSTSGQSATETANQTTKIDLIATRVGNLSGPAKVEYVSVNGTANDRSDYLTALGTLYFSAGESVKTIPVFIVNDSYGEPQEAFSVNLTNHEGCTLGSQTTFTVTINSDESVNGTNPVKNATFNNDFFVRQHYLDFFNREPDTGGLNFWKNQLQECENVPLPGGFTDAQQCREIRRINVSAAFFLSIEFQETGYLVERLYKSAYGNASGTSTFGGTHTLAVPIVRFNEFLADTQQIGRGVVIGQPGANALLEANKQTLIAQFVARARFTTTYPASLTPTQFVDALNTSAGGVLSTSELSQLITDLTNGNKNRAQVLRAVAEDSDLVNAEKNKAFVLAQFIGYLRRNPNDTPDADYTGYDFWLGKLNQFGGNFVSAEMVKAFIVSGEYQQRFGS